MYFKIKILINLIFLKWSKWRFKNNIPTLQKKRWTKHLNRLNKSDYYKSILEKSKDLKDFPIVNKQIFMSHFDEINTCSVTIDQAMQIALKAETSRDFSPQINGVTVGLSTGTSGNRGCFLVSEDERAMWVACVLDRVIGFSLKKRKVAFFLRANSNLYQSVQSKLLEFNYFDILNNPDTHLQPINLLQPDIIVAPPSMLSILAKAMEEGHIKLNPSQVISVAEVLTVDDRMYLEKIFSQTIHQVYQCTEGLLATTCECGTLHFNEDFLIIEKKFINKEKTKFHPIITDLFRTSQPIIRYELNDIITIKESCPCGSKLTAIEQIEGRSDDILIFTDVSGNEIQIFPDIFRRTIVLSDESINDFQLIQYSSAKLGLYINSNKEDAYRHAEIALTQMLYDSQIQSISIEKIDNDPHILGTKKRRVKNDSRKSN